MDGGTGKRKIDRSRIGSIDASLPHLGGKWRELQIEGCKKKNQKPKES